MEVLPPDDLSDNVYLRHPIALERVGSHIDCDGLNDRFIMTLSAYVRDRHTETEGKTDRKQTDRKGQTNRQTYECNVKYFPCFPVVSNGRELQQGNLPSSWYPLTSESSYVVYVFRYFSHEGTSHPKHITSLLTC